jgi:signal transduction histidine kinase/putative methionine-R-sulfoxide reductase with GAF domain
MTENPIRSMIGAPLIWGGEVVAGLFAHSVETDAYSDRDLQLFERVATQIAGPVAGSILRAREAELAAERDLLASISSLMGSALDLSDAWSEFADLVTGVIDADLVALIGVDGEHGTAEVMIERRMDEPEASKLHVGSKYDLSGTLAGTVYESGRSLISNNETTAELVGKFPGARQTMPALRFKSTLAVPLIWGGRVVAVLFLNHRDLEKYGSSDQELAERIVSQISGPVAGSILRAQEAELARELELLATIGTLMSAAIDLDRVWVEFSDLVSQAIAFDRLDLVSIDHDNDRASVLHDRWITEQIPDIASTGASYGLSGSVAAHVAQTRESIAFSHENPDQLQAKFPNAFRPDVKYPFLSNMAIPLAWGGDVVAVLFFSKLETSAYGTRQVELAGRIAAQIAGPVAGSLLRQREIELDQERSLRERAELKITALSELNETKNNFVSAMSHELRTPLTSIVAFADIMSRTAHKEISERGQDHLKVIQRNARRLEGMIDELLDLSRMESGRFEISRSSFDFVSMIQECLESAGPQFESLSQTIYSEIEEDVLPVNGDRGRLMQVVNNLLNNASKFSPEGSDIELAVAEKNEWLTVEVRDRGPGVPEEKPEELFEMFHRADNELTRRVPGTGIGLHISKRIIDEHGGEITLDSRTDGPGAIAAFRIPTVVRF